MPVPVPTPRGLWYTYRLWSDLFKGTWPEVQKRIQFYLSKYFYKDDLLKAFLFDRDFAELPKNRFIDYARYLNYYASDIKETTLKMGEASKDRKSTRLNSSHTVISYAVFCLKKKK